MKKIVVLFFAFVFCFTAVQADENYYTLSIDTPKETDKLMYCNADFVIGGKALSDWLLMLPDIRSLNDILERLGVS